MTGDKHRKKVAFGLKKWQTLCLSRMSFVTDSVQTWVVVVFFSPSDEMLSQYKGSVNC